MRKTTKTSLLKLLSLNKFHYSATDSPFQLFPTVSKAELRPWHFRLIDAQYSRLLLRIIIYYKKKNMLQNI